MLLCLVMTKANDNCWQLDRQSFKQMQSIVTIGTAVSSLSGFASAGFRRDSKHEQ